MSNIFDQICCFDNLYRAFLKARCSKRSQESVACFERRLEAELFQLQDELLSQTYRPGSYRSFYRTEAKRRLISAAPFRDRVADNGF
jgi:RNA-directed DNA polymerase